MIMERNFQPVIIFSFSKKECEAYALQMSKLDFNSGKMILWRYMYGGLLKGRKGGQWLVWGTSAQNVWVQTLVRYISVAHLQLLGKPDKILAVVLQCDKWKLFFNWSHTCSSFPFLGQEKKLVEEVFNNAIDCLSDEDKTLPQVKLYVNKAAL